MLHIVRWELGIFAINFILSVEPTTLDDDTVISETELPLIEQAAGTHGLVPAPSAGDNDKFLGGDGTWKDVPAELRGLTDVALTNPANGQLLRYDATAQKWKNYTPAEPVGEVLSNYTITANIGVSGIFVARYGKVVMVSVTIAPASTGWITIATGLPVPLTGSPNTVGTSDGGGHAMSNICHVIYTGELQMYVTDQNIATYTITYICV